MFFKRKEKNLDKMECNFRVVCLKCGCDDCTVLKFDNEDGITTVDVHCPECDEEYEF